MTPGMHIQYIADIGMSINAKQIAVFGYIYRTSSSVALCSNSVKINELLQCMHVLQEMKRLGLYIHYIH